MNDTNLQLISLLRENTVTGLAKRLRISRVTVLKREAVPEVRGVITGYTLRVNPGVEKNKVCAWLSLAVEEK